MDLKRFLAVATALAVALPSAAFANWSANFISPTGPTSTLKIDLPDDLDIMTLTTLGVELDGIDITALLSLDGTDFVYTPVQPLSDGEHVIRLVTLGDEIEEKGNWAFNIRGSDATSPQEPSESQIAAAENWLRGGSVSIDTLTEVSRRTFSANMGNNPPNQTIISGAGDVNAQQPLGRWDVRAKANYLVMSDPDLSLTGDPVDLGEYTLSADYADDKVKGGVTLGHHDLGLDSYLFSGFYRRGASAHVGSADDRMQATGFAFRPESVSGRRDFTGVQDQADRLEGWTATVKPFSDDVDALNVTGIFYDGSQDGGDTGTSSTGSGYGTIVKKSFGQERITLRGEYAHALYDPDGGANVSGEDAADALTFSFEANPFEESPVFFDKSLDMVVGARYERIDTFFQSLANEGIASDRSALTTYGYLYWGALSTGLQLTHETNNVDDLESTPTDRLRNLALNVAYSFDTQTGQRAWLGSPYVNFSAFVADMDRVETPTGYTGFNTNNVSDSLTFGGGSSYEKWYWSASHTFSEYEDYANVSDDTVSNSTTLSAGWAVNDRLEINGGIAFSTFKDEDAGTSNYDTNVNFGTTANIIPEKLDLNFDYNLNLASGSGDTPDRHIANSEVEYTLIQPSKNSPGMALAIRGSMENTHGNANRTQDETQYQIFTVLRIKAPFGFGS